jgi:hypothetical protein
MKNVNEVLKEKELRVEAVTREIEALRIAASLLDDAAELIPKIPAQPEHPLRRIEGTTGSSVTEARFKGWP